VTPFEADVIDRLARLEERVNEAVRRRAAFAPYLSAGAAWVALVLTVLTLMR
jgi:hypothetical protein